MGRVMNGPRMAKNMENEPPNPSFSPSLAVGSFPFFSHFFPIFHSMPGDGARDSGVCQKQSCIMSWKDGFS